MACLRASSQPPGGCPLPSPQAIVTLVIFAAAGPEGLFIGPQTLALAPIPRPFQELGSHLLCEEAPCQGVGDLASALARVRRSCVPLLSPPAPTRPGCWGHHHQETGCGVEPASHIPSWAWAWRWLLGRQAKISRPSVSFLTLFPMGVCIPHGFPLSPSCLCSQAPSSLHPWFESTVAFSALPGGELTVSSFAGTPQAGKLT